MPTSDRRGTHHPFYVFVLKEPSDMSQGPSSRNFLYGGPVLDVPGTFQGLPVRTSLAGRSRDVPLHAGKAINLAGLWSIRFMATLSPIMVSKISWDIKKVCTRAKHSLGVEIAQEMRPRAKVYM